MMRRDVQRWRRNIGGNVGRSGASPNRVQLNMTTLFSDNQLAITLAKEHQYHTCTKHIDVRYHFICWIIKEGKIKLIYCPTDKLVADALTKVLPSTKVKHFANELGLVANWGEGNRIRENRDGKVIVVTISSPHVQFTCSFSLLLPSEQHATNACSSYFYHSSCITHILHASDAWLSYMPLLPC